MSLTPTEIDIAWAAGLFEGEGCLTILHNKSTEHPCVKLSSTDKDTIIRFFKIIKLGQIREERFDLRNKNWKRQWIWYVSSKSDVLKVIKIFYPFLGKRRRKRAKEVLKTCKYKYSVVQ